jgi:DNA-binding CsgD family transcriptional regulator
MGRILNISEKEFIENKRELGKTCQEIADVLGINYD